MVIVINSVIGRFSWVDSDWLLQLSKYTVWLQLYQMISEK